MKFRLSSAIAALCGCLGVSTFHAVAQPDTALHVSVGVHAEYGLPKLSIRPYTSAHGGMRWGTGLSVRLDNSNIFGMNVELNYAFTDYRVEEDTPRPFNESTFIPGEQRGSLQWLELPLIAEIGYQFPKWRIYALGGGYADYLLSERFGAPGAMTEQPLLLSTHYRLGGGLLGGAGIGFVSRYGALIFEYRAGLRLVNLYKRNVEGGLETPSQKLASHSFGLTYYYTFTVRKKERK